MKNWLDCEHIIWDWNGTLLDDLDLVVDITNGMLARRNRSPIDRRFYREHFGFPVREFYRRMGFDFSSSANSDLYDRLVIEFSNEYESRCRSCQLYDGAADILDLLRVKKISQSILSASDQAFLAESVQSFGINQYFREIAGLDNKQAGGKVQAGHHLMEQLGLPADKTLLIGDTVHDCEVAAALGVQCLIILNGYNGPERFQGISARTVPALSELISKG